MRTKTAIAMLVIILAAFLCALPAHGNSNESAETKAKLEILVDEYIACCEAKSAMRNSRSENIRRSAIRSCMKAAYCRHSREELVREMLENNIEPKAYKVRLYLNKKFHGHVQAKE
jgi:hypothetical protein